MINILYCVPALYNPGGMERILIEKANYLSELDEFNIYIITTDQKRKNIYFELSPKVNVTHLDLDFDQYFDKPILEKYFKIKKIQKNYRNILKEYIVNNKIDIIVSLGGKELDFLYKLDVDCKKICELHFSINIREQFMLARGNNLKNKLIGKYRTFQLIKQTKLLDCLVVLTKSDQEKLQKTHNNVLQIYNFSSFLPDEKSNLSNKVIVAVGKLDPQKGFDLLIEACKNINNWNGWQLHIYGQGPDKQKLENMVKKNNLKEYIYFKGITHNLGEVYNNASFFVLSSRYEGFPMVLLEAISFGLPIVAFDCETGPNEIIKNNDCGILVENGNIIQLGIKMEDMIHNHSLIIQKSIASFSKAKDFSKDYIMEQWISLFKSLN